MNCAKDGQGTQASSVFLVFSWAALKMASLWSCGDGNDTGLTLLRLEDVSRRRSMLD